MDRETSSLSFLKIRGCEAYVKDKSQISWHRNMTNAFLRDILKQLKDITFIIPLRTKCLLLGMVSFWKGNLFPKELVGAKYISKSFKSHNKA